MENIKGFRVVRSALRVLSSVSMEDPAVAHAESQCLVMSVVKSTSSLFLNPYCSVAGACRSI